MLKHLSPERTEIGAVIFSALNVASECTWTFQGKSSYFKRRLRVNGRASEEKRTGLIPAALCGCMRMCADVFRITYISLRFGKRIFFCAYAIVLPELLYPLLSDYFESVRLRMRNCMLPERLPPLLSDRSPSSCSAFSSICMLVLMCVYVCM